MLRQLVIAASLAVCAATYGQRTLRVSASSRIRPAMVSVSKLYERSKPGVKVVVVSSDDPSAASASVRIAPAEASREAASARTFARDPIVVVVADRLDGITKFAQLASDLRLAWPNDKSVVGKHVASVLAAAESSYGKDWSANLQQNRKEETETGEAAVDLLLDGQVDGVIVSLSQAAKAKGKATLIYLPPELGQPIDFTASIRPKAPELSVAKDFVEFLYRAGIQQHIEAQGFLSPLRPPPELPIIKGSGVLRLFVSALETHPKETIKTRDSRGRSVSVTGVSLRKLFADEKSGTLTLTGADGQVVSLPMKTLAADGAVLVRMSDGNYQVVFGKKPPGQWLRWLRRIEIKA